MQMDLSKDDVGKYKNLCEPSHGWWLESLNFSKLSIPLSLCNVTMPIHVEISIK